MALLRYKDENGVWQIMTNAQGIQGIQGEQGEQGIQGELGPTGEKGDKGDQGPKGDQGIQGEQGPKGDTGLTGADSTVAGPKGDKGDQGPKGDKGDTGSMGNLGTVANKPVITGTGGLPKAGEFGSGANTFAEGNHTHAQYAAISGQTFTGTVKVPASTAYTTAQVRNIVLSTSDASGGSNGDVWFKYE